MKITIENLRSRKTNGRKIVMLTSYDYPTALIEDACGVDIQLIGDSVGTNVLGYPGVEYVTMEDIVHHTKAVARGSRNSFVLADMPFGTFSTNETAFVNAKRLIEAGADGVKMEGEEETIEQVRYVAGKGITVCAHIGYTPQTDGTKASVQGKDFSRAKELINIARRLEQAGAGIMVLELIPEQLAGEITRCLTTVPTIGIGAGVYCDGQVQVINDIAGLSQRIFRHAKKYGDLKTDLTRIISEYAGEVRDKTFPSAGNTSLIPDQVLKDVRDWIAGGNNLSS